MSEKQSTLQKYALAGYLDFGSKNIAAGDRVSAGCKLCVDYYLGGGEEVKAIDMSKIRVDGGGNGERTVKCMHHQDMYRKAMKCVPSEFWPVVRRVCIEDKPLNASGSAIDIKRKLYAQRVDLCRGLDRLVQFYERKKIR